MSVTNKDSLVAGVPLGGIIPRRLVKDPSLVVLEYPMSQVTERYRRLAAKLERAKDGEAARTVVMTSATAAEGKTVTSINLALAMAEEREKTTLVVDGDMRRPTLSKFVTPEPKLGLSEVLAGSVPLEHALIRLKNSKLVVLPAGGRVSNPLEILQPETARSLLADLRQLFDRIVIDTPPVVPFTDAAVLAGEADGALVVLRASRTAKPTFDRAIEALEGTNILGVVLNDTKATPVDRYYYYYDEYDPERYSAD